MALLHRVRGRGRGGVGAGFLALLLLVGGCEDPPDPELLPDTLLRDSLGLDDDDRVWTVRLTAPENRERLAPSEVRIGAGGWLQFVTGDRRLHVVRFLMDEMPPAQAEFLRRTGQDESPPLLELGARLVLTFEDAPEGRYPYRVTGNGEAADGLVIVGLEEGSGG